MNKTQLRKLGRKTRYQQLIGAHRDACRSLIASLRRLENPKAKPEDFRASLKKQNQRFSLNVAGRGVSA
jgi:hypothetical protein